MTQAQIRIGITLLIAQLIMLAMTMAFHHSMDESAARAGLTEIITEAVR